MGKLIPAATLSVCIFFTLAPAVPAQHRDPLPVPDLPEFKTLKCDFHIHTVFSDGEVWPTTRVAEAWSDGLDAIALTDHVGHHPHRTDLSTDLNRPYEIAKPQAERLGLILIPGVEIMEGNTHFNALFVTDATAFAGLKLLPALRVAASQKAFVFWDHPGWKETPQWGDLIRNAHQESLFKGVELVNGLTFYPEVFRFVAERQLTILADSDVHAPIRTEYEPRTRPVTLVFARSRDSAGIREALDSRRTAAWVNGQVWGPSEILSGLWRESVELENKQFVLDNSTRTAAVRIRNKSAIPFHLKPKQCPAWLYCGQADIAALSTGLLPLTIVENAPRGHHVVDLEVELVNMHPAPGENLPARVAFEIEIR